MAQLYTTSNGRAVTTNSYSSAADFAFCKRFFKLKRIDGYRPKGDRAALEFGKCIESAIQYFYESNRKPGSGVDELKRLWLKWENVPLIFTAKEGCWRDLYTTGAEMMQLFEVLAPSLPIHNPVFQAAYRKEIFPGTTLAGIEDVGYADIISKTPKGQLLIDVKTAANAYDLAAEFIALDPQLGRYSWHSGIRDVAFMTFVKARPENFDSGETVTLLEDSGNWKAGATGKVFPLPPPKRAKDEPEPEPIDPHLRSIPLVSEADYDRFKEEAKGIRGKALDEKKTEFFAAVGIILLRSQVTKTRIEFMQGRIPDHVVETIDRNVKYQTAEIERCARLNDWPMEPSVRGMDKKCLRCEMRGHCTGRQDLVEKLLVQITPAPEERDWLDELTDE